MIIGIFGLPGAGKTALNTHFLINDYQKNGLSRLRSSSERIEKYAREQKRAFTLPSKAPYYATYPVKFLIGYEEYYQPYIFNPYYFGFKNDNLKVMRVAPNAQIHISEAQKYFDSRQSATFPSWVSRAWETHRHFGIDMYYDVQRIDLVDLNIRRITERFYCVQEMENISRATGAIDRSLFHVLRFDSYAEVESYLTAGTGGKAEIIEHKGNIFDCYNSYDSEGDFIPENEEDFEYIDQSMTGKRVKQLMNVAEPHAFRHKNEEK